jgi:putative transposase
MEKVRNIFSVDVDRYVKKSSERKVAFAAACAIWSEAAQQLFCV